MADVKWNKYIKHTQTSYAFGKITGFNIAFNVKATLLMKGCKRVDVLLDKNKSEITFIPNNKGEYAVVIPEGRRNCLVCIQSILSEVGNVNKDRRYLVSENDKGFSIVLEKCGE